MWTFARGSETILITSETTGWKLQPVVSLRVITTIDGKRKKLLGHEHWKINGCLHVLAIVYVVNSSSNFILPIDQIFHI